MKVSDDDPEQARRFRDVALPCLDDVYTLARYLLRDPDDAEDAVQECYLRALKHFHSFRGPAIKPWLFAILRNVCHAEYARRATLPTAAMPEVKQDADTPETQILRRLDAATIRRLVADLDPPFREAIVLREIHNLSYREIADIVVAPVGTVMSRLSRARALLRAGWIAEQEQAR